MPTDHDRRDETHLGDGVYARFDGFLIWLRANDNNWDLPTPSVALEDTVVLALIDYAKRVGVLR